MVLTYLLADAKAALFTNADADFLPLTIYTLHWNIETAHYEQKAFWALGDYRLRSKVGIERLVNLLTINEQIQQFDENMRLSRTKLLKLSTIQELLSVLLCNFSNLLIYSF